MPQISYGLESLPMTIAYRLANKQYDNFTNILNLSVDMVVDMWQYDLFIDAIERDMLIQQQEALRQQSNNSRR